MPIQLREIYASENGDRWSLGRETETGRVFVRHDPNLASGGRSSEVEVGAFLVGGGRGPEHQALMRLIGSLVGDEPSTGDPRAAGSSNALSEPF